MEQEGTRFYGVCLRHAPPHCVASVANRKKTTVLQQGCWEPHYQLQLGGEKPLPAAKRNVVAPPRTQSGIDSTRPPVLPITPNRKSQKAAPQPAHREATPVKEMTPLFCSNSQMCSQKRRADTQGTVQARR